MKTFKKKKYIALSHDYGGGHNLYLFIKKNFLSKTNFSFSGPSSKILKRNQIKNINRSKTLANYSKVFYSLSWDKNVEKYISSQKKIYDFKTSLILDGWGNYKSKLTYNNKAFYPDQIICFDKFSLMIAKKQFHKLQIFLDNYLLEDLNKLKNKLKKKKKNKILYLTSPLIKKKYIKNILNYIKDINYPNKVEIRYHPSEKKKFKPLTADLKNVLKVYGHYSSLLIYSKLMGINTYSINYSRRDIFKWKQLGIFKNYRIREIYDKSFDIYFKKKF